MANITTVMEPWGSLAGDLTEHLLHFRVSSLVTITKGYPVQLINGYLEPMDGTVADDDVAGVAAETVAGTTASAKCAIYTDPNILYANDADATLAFADVGKVYRVLADKGQIDGSTGLVQSDQAFILVKVDPYEENDFSAGLFKIYSSYWSANDVA